MARAPPPKSLVRRAERNAPPTCRRSGAPRSLERRRKAAGRNSLSVVRRWIRQRQRKLNHSSAVMLGYFVSKLTHVYARLRHTDHLVAPRYKRANTDILSQLTMPPYARRRLIVFQVLCDIIVQRVVDHFDHKLAPPFRPAMKRTAPSC